MLSRLREFDLYRRIPKDLTESTPHGAVLSLCASIFMLVLFVAELWSFLSAQISTNVVIDPNTDSLLRINFNITVMDLPCEFAMIDVVDVLGTRNDNVTKNINKWQIDENGVRRNYEGRNLEQKDLAHDEHHDLVALHSNGVHAVPVDQASFEPWIATHHYTFVNFYAPWCIWCQRLEPVWEAFAERVEMDRTPVSIIKVTMMITMMITTAFASSPSLCVYVPSIFCWLLRIGAVDFDFARRGERSSAGSSAGSKEAAHLSHRAPTSPLRPSLSALHSRPLRPLRLSQ